MLSSNGMGFGLRTPFLSLMLVYLSKTIYYLTKPSFHVNDPQFWQLTQIAIHNACYCVLDNFEMQIERYVTDFYLLQLSNLVYYCHLKPIVMRVVNYGITVFSKLGFHLDCSSTLALVQLSCHLSFFPLSKQVNSWGRSYSLNQPM